jgi:hypothetical protein
MHHPMRKNLIPDFACQLEPAACKRQTVFGTLGRLAAFLTFPVANSPKRRYDIQFAIFIGDLSP